MKAETYKALLKDLQKLQKTLVASQIEAVRRDPGLLARMTRLHAEAEVGGRVDDFVAMAARKSTVLFLLRSVFVRVLEDLGILGIKRIRDDWGFAAFREVAPALGLRAYFAFVFRDLAVDFPALFAAGEDELPLPDEDGCRGLWNLWHHPNRDGEHYVWSEDGFDSRFLGDLYQDLDADIRKRYALLQTPRFVEEYILDHTLTPALAEFDPARLRAEGKTFRVLDPTCGSGHFLIGAFHRLADYWRGHGLDESEACDRALESVWGCDINPHAVEIAHFRLLLEVVTRTKVRDLDRLANLAPNLRAMDSLVPWERATQGDFFSAKDRLDHYATSRQRSDSASFLGKDFHVVVGNPPYITPKDGRKRDDYATFWPEACFANYALSAPFAVRFFSLASAALGFVGQITSNSFMRRLFGKLLVEVELPRWDITRIVDTSGAYIPGHGTPTVMIFGRARRPEAACVHAVLGKRGEPARPVEPANGLVWRAIIAASVEPDDSDPFVTIAMLRRADLAKHPWSLGGGLARPLMDAICRADPCLALLGDRVVEVGRSCIVGESTLFEFERAALARLGAPDEVCHELYRGEALRDYALGEAGSLLLPNSLLTGLHLPIVDLGGAVSLFWRCKQHLRARVVSGSTKMEAAGKVWYEARRVSSAKFQTPTSLAFPLISTHNHVVLGLEREVFHESAPMIKLPATATLEDHLDLLGLLNSSTLGFWMKQVFHNKGYGASGDGARTTAQDWENFWEYDSTKLQQAPITSKGQMARVPLARALDAIAQERAACQPASLLAARTWSPASIAGELSTSHARFLTLTHRMVALQEELDWLTYADYGLLDPVATVGPDAIEPLAPGHRPFEIVLARKDDEADDDEKSAWWSRHGHERVTEIPNHYSDAHRARLQERVELIESDPRLALLETPPYKRRWQLPDWPSETKKAAESWLLDRLEDLFAPATDATPRGPLADPKAYRLEDVAVALSRDPRVAAVAGVWAGTGVSVDVTLVAEKLLRANALPDNPHRLYSDEGLRKLDEWKRVWALQDQEDVWEKAVEDAKSRGETPPKKRLVDPDDGSIEVDAIPLPPKFDKVDFVRAEYFSTRGKLNVRRERFILFADLSPPRYGWNGWRDRERALAQVEAFTLAENDPQEPLAPPTSEEPKRCGVTFGLWESLPDVRRWGSAAEHGELQALAREACRQIRCPCPVLDAWKLTVLRAKPSSEAKPKSKAKAKAATVSLAQRAWVVSLFPPGKELEASGVWARHQARVAGPPQLGLPGVDQPAAQLNIPLDADAPHEHASLDVAQLARVLDDLVASGDLEVAGRGTKKRYQVIVRSHAGKRPS